MSVFYSNIDQAISDKAVTQPLPQVSIPSRFPPPKWGPRWGGPPTDQTVMHLETFNPPVFQPRGVPRDIINVSGTGNIPELCPVATVLLRNEYETYNTTSGKVYGGFDPYSVQNIPSCNERSGSYMNFMDFTRPWSRVMVEPRGDEWTLDSHGGTWAKQKQPWEISREGGTKLE